ncbi:hypothetical protein F7R91_05830 [Streptomyces luteolifulvus]|jgi:hypothetical protein|uniref:Uncharacterized protein n=1 Tax=Streptomyces luteolifulvus TaxID=2615112 RepID=A0A6H9V3E3_9ACTN|nr:hypothetical protein [Streptomyces luteolifulvus]KAB1149275.1 hypothetical protein F7R91_05830 [Streptomyces luteolifulvus]
MDCTLTTGRLLLDGADQQASYGEPLGPSRADPPIYAALVRQWRAGGRMFPGARDPQWTVLTSVSPVVISRYWHA